jgi:hypothetical protein
MHGFYLEGVVDFLCRFCVFAFALLWNQTGIYFDMGQLTYIIGQAEPDLADKPAAQPIAEELAYKLAGALGERLTAPRL